MNIGLKNTKDVLGRVSGGSCSNCSGDGNEYNLQSLLIDMNHDLDESGSVDRIFVAIWQRMFSGSLDIIPNKDNCLL